MGDSEIYSYIVERQLATRGSWANKIIMNIIMILSGDLIIHLLYDIPIKVDVMLP